MKPAPFLPLAAALSGCAANLAEAGGPRPDPAPATYRALGHAPEWRLSMSRRIVFEDASGKRVVQDRPRVIVGFAGEIYRTARLNLNIVHGRCLDRVSGEAYPDTVQLSVDGRSLTGCGGR